MWDFGSLIVHLPPSLQFSSSHRGLIPSTNYAKHPTVLLNHLRATSKSHSRQSQEKCTYKMQKSADWHDRGSSEVRLNLPELANCLEFGDDFVGDLISLRHIRLMLLLLNHSPHSVTLLQSEVCRRNIVGDNLSSLLGCQRTATFSVRLFARSLWLEFFRFLSNIVCLLVGD